MALTIVNEQYPPRKPKLTLTANSLDELPTEGVAEGSTATVDGTEYSYDSNAGWIEPGSGGGSGGGVMWVNITATSQGDTVSYSADKTNAEIYSAANSGKMVFCKMDGSINECHVYSLVYLHPESATFSKTNYANGSGYSEQIDIDDDVVSWTAWTWTVEDDS